MNAYTVAFLVFCATVLVLTYPDRSMERCLLTHSYDACHQMLNR